MMNDYSDGLWYAEHDASDGTHYYSVRSILFDGQTAYHDVKILVTEEWGKTLVIDGDIQSTEFDEALFHEAAVHPALLTHANPETVLIVGSDDGAVLREVLAHGSVRSVTLTGIDDEFVDICAEHLPEWSGGYFESPYAKLEFEESEDFLRRSDKKFDVIIADLSAYEEEDSPVNLKSNDLYRLLSSRLNADGILVIYGLEFDTGERGDYATYLHAIGDVFSVVANYTAHIPSFRDESMFLIASNGPDPRALTASEIQKRLSERGANADKDVGARLQFYDADTHTRMFSLPKNVKAVLNGAIGRSGH